MSRKPLQRQVYFIKPVGLDGPVKVGCSHIPAKRLISLMTWSPFKLEVIGSVPGTANDERFLHQCFAKWHSHAEWFYPTRDFQNAVQAILEHGIGYARENLTETGKIRHHFRSPETRAKMSASLRESWVHRKAREAAKKAVSDAS